MTLNAPLERVWLITHLERLNSTYNELDTLLLSLTNAMRRLSDTILHARQTTGGGDTDELLQHVYKSVARDENLKCALQTIDALLARRWGPLPRSHRFYTLALLRLGARDGALNYAQITRARLGELW